MTAPLVAGTSARAVPVTPVATDGRDAWLAGQPEELRRWAESSGFRARHRELSLVADGRGRLARVLYGVERPDALWSYADLPRRLPAGRYRIDARLGVAGATAAATGWALGGYAFDRYRKERPERPPALVWPRGADRARVAATVAAVSLVRDLINTPAADMGPSQLAAAARRLGREFGARVAVTTGDALLRRNYAAIHAVGRASAEAPRLIDLRWGDPRAPRVTVVGKGV